MVEKFRIEKSGFEKSEVEMSFKLKVRGNFNPGLFNHRLFNHELFNPKSGVEKSGVGKFMVEKSGVEKTRVGKFMVKIPQRTFQPQASIPDSE